MVTKAEKAAAAAAAAGGAGGTPAAINMVALANIVAQTGTGGFAYISEADAAPMLNYAGGALIQVNTAFKDAEGKMAAQSTPAGTALVNGASATPPVTAGTAGDTSGAAPGAAAKRSFAIAAVELGERVRRARGPAEAVYPFADLPEPTPEQSNRKQWPSFFVPVSDKMPDPIKSMTSTVAGAMKRFGKKTGEKEVTRAKRGSGRGAKAILDDHGKKIMEVVKVPTYEYDRKFEIFPIADGAPWGFPGQKGAAIARVS